MIWPPPIEVTRPIDDEDAPLAGDLDDEADHARRVVLAVHDEDVAHLADPIARGVEDGAPGESGDEDSRGAHATNLAPGTGNAALPAARRPHAGAWENGGVTNPSPFGGRMARAFPTLPKGETVASFETYAEAQAAVDKLAKAEFPVKELAIVGTDLTSVERITGTLSWGRAAGAGAISGAWFGTFLGLLFFIFAPTGGHRSASSRPPCSSAPASA